LSKGQTLFKKVLGKEAEGYWELRPWFKAMWFKTKANLLLWVMLSCYYLMFVRINLTDLTQKRHNSTSGRGRGRFLIKRNLFLRKVSNLRQLER